jgi:hypothetical protein
LHRSRCQLRRSRWCRTAGCRGGATGGTRWVRCRRWGHGGVIFGEKGLAGDASLKLLATPDANRRPVRRGRCGEIAAKTRPGPAPTPSRFGSPDPVPFATRYFWRRGNGGFSHPFGKLPRAGPQGLGSHGCQGICGDRPQNEGARVTPNPFLSLSIECRFVERAGGSALASFWSFVDHGL